MACVDLESTIDFVRGFFTPDFPEQSLPIIATENLKFLLRTLDWRLARCYSAYSPDTERLPSLSPMDRVFAHRSTGKGGNFMFLENPDRFDFCLGADICTRFELRSFGAHGRAMFSLIARHRRSIAAPWQTRGGTLAWRFIDSISAIPTKMQVSDS